MQKLIWQNANGDEINLTSGNYGITEWEGFSNASLNIQSQQVPFQDGGVFLDALIEQRELSVTLKMQDNGDLEERYRMRRELIHALNPKLGEGYLIYTNDFTSKRIKCVPQIPLFPTHNSNDSGTPSASLAWTACEPYWEDLEETEVVLNNGVVTNIENEGDVDIGFKAVINPPCVNPKIVNLIEEKSINIQKSITENTEINTGFGKKSIEEIKYNYKYEQGGVINDILLKDSEIYLGGEVVTKFNSFNKNELIKTVPVIENHILAGFRYYGGKYYIWYDHYNKFLISEDLQTFVTVTTPNNYLVRKIFYINNKIIVSTGVYTYQYENNEFIHICDSLYDLIYKNGYYYGLTQYSVLKTDVLDVNSWETVKDFYNEMSSSDFLYELSFENGIFVILMNYNSGAKIFTSTDMDIWNESALIEDVLDMYGIYSKRLCFCNNLFFIITSSYIITTLDGINFNIYESPIRTYEVQTCMNTDGNSVFISNAQGLLISTRNGIAYENILGVIIPNRYSDVKYYNGSYYVSGGMRNYEGVETQGLYKSSDCKKWDLLINGFYVSDFVIFGNSFIGKRNAGGVISIFKSNGGQFAETFNASLSQYGELENIVCNNNKICAITKKGYIIKSNDGIDWDIVEIDTNKTFNRIAICNNQFVIVGNNGVIYTSDNLTEWVLLSTSIDENINDIIFKKFYLICTSAGKIYRSNNLLQFELVGNYFTNKFYEIFSNIEFISNNMIVKTQDGNTFIEDNIGVMQNLILACLICGHNGKFLIGQVNGLLYDSTEQKTNIIDKLTSDSDMSLKLKVGKNQYKTQSQSGSFTTVLSYRQKYIGV